MSEIQYRRVHVASVEEYFKAFDDGFVNIAYEGRVPKELLDELKKRAETDFNARFDYASMISRLGEEETGQSIFLGLVEEGYLPAHNALAYNAARGIAGPVDEKAAFEHLQQIESLNLPSACLNLGTSYRRGIGVEKDLEKAKEYYRKGAIGGNSSAAYWYFVMLEEDYQAGVEGITVDDVRNALFEAAFLGSEGAMRRVESGYEEGDEYLPCDPVAAHAWGKAIERMLNPRLPLIPGGERANPGRYIPQSEDDEAARWEDLMAQLRDDDEED